MYYFSNPQGKGVVSVVSDLQAYAPISVQAKNSHQWLADYFTSTLVLGAKYGFKPVVGRDYYLYFKDQEWRLSLIEPQAWNSQDAGIFFAECELNKDMSWSLVLAPGWQEHSSITKIINELEQKFFQSLNDETPIVEKLPFFMQELSYYQRLGANALARSLKQSLKLQYGNESLSSTGTQLIAEMKDKELPLLISC